MRRNGSRLGVFVGGGVMLFVSGGSFVAQAATVPYTETFDSFAIGDTTPIDNSGANWVETNSSQWSIVGGGLSGSGPATDRVYRAASGALVGSTSNIRSTVQVAGLGGAPTSASNFVVSTDFRLNTASVTGGTAASDIRIGLGALGATSDFAGGAGGAFYLADVAVASTNTMPAVGQFRIVEIAATNTFLASDTSSGIAINNTDLYQLQLTGTYVGSSLNLSLVLRNLTQGTSSSPLSVTDATPLTGNVFGYRNRVAGGTGVTATLDATFDNFSVAIPEPGTVGVAVLGAAGLLARRSRRSGSSAK
jgi:hypothetical protein